MCDVKRGKFITFEGAEGAGKSTQVKLLASYIAKKYQSEVVVTREPGGTPLAEKLREIIKYYKGTEIISERSELLLIEAARNQHVVNLIDKSLTLGKFVICDRFYDSTYAYQGFGRKLDLDFINKINRFAVDNCKPDLTIYLDVDLKTGFKRVNSRAEEMQNLDRFESAGNEFHLAVKAGFKDIANKEPQRFKVVDANQSIDDVHQQICRIIDEQL